MAKKIVNDVLKKTKTAKKAAEAVTKNTDEGVTAVRKMTGNFNGKITELQNKVDSGVPISSAVSDYLDQREKVNNAVAKRRALNEASQSQGKGNRANRRAKEIDDNKLANAIADGRELAKQQRDLADMSHSRQSRINQKNAQAQEISDARRSIRNDNKEINKDSIANAIGQMRDNRIANDIAESYRGQGNKANRRIQEMRERQVAPKLHEQKVQSLQKQIDAAADAEDLDKMISLQKQLDDLGEYKAPGPKKTFQERKAERVEKYENAKIAKEMEGSFGDIEHTRPTNKKTATPQSETSPSGGNTSIIQQAQDKIKGNNFVYNMAAMGVGGGLVLNMANNKGQQSNAQLYGQY